METLPQLDVEPDHWGPDHDDLELTAVEISEGNRQGDDVDVDDDSDNGL